MRPALLLTVLLFACSGNYSPDTYSTAAVQQAAKVDQGIVVGVREVVVTPSGTVGAVTGGAAGGIAGAQTPAGSVGQAFGALGGTVIGGLVGAGVEQASGKTRAFEYVVRKTAGELVSVTQTDAASMPIGQKVLVIAGPQARIVPDYTVEPPKPPAPEPPLTAPPPPPVTAEPLPAPSRPQPP